MPHSDMTASKWGTRRQRNGTPVMGHLPKRDRRFGSARRERRWALPQGSHALDEALMISGSNLRSGVLVGSSTTSDPSDGGATRFPVRLRVGIGRDSASHDLMVSLRLDPQFGMHHA